MHDKKGRGVVGKGRGRRKYAPSLSELPPDKQSKPVS